MMFWSFINFDGLVKALDNVLVSFVKANLKFNPDKCTFAAKQCEYLGHELSEQ